MASISNVCARIKDDLEKLLEPGWIEDVCGRLGYLWRQRVLGPVETVHLFVLQLLAGNTALTHLRRLAAAPDHPRRGRKTRGGSLADQLHRRGAMGVVGRTRRNGASIDNQSKPPRTKRAATREAASQKLLPPEQTSRGIPEGRTKTESRVKIKLMPFARASRPWVAVLRSKIQERSDLASSLKHDPGDRKVTFTSGAQPPSNPKINNLTPSPAQKRHFPLAGAPADPQTLTTPPSIWRLFMRANLPRFVSSLRGPPRATILPPHPAIRTTNPTAKTHNSAQRSLSLPAFAAIFLVDRAPHSSCRA